MGTEEHKLERLADAFSAESDPPSAETDDGAGLANLLDSVLEQTLGEGEGLNLLQEVAKNSDYPEANSLAAFEEVVSAILGKRFGTLLNNKVLTSRVAQTLFDSPEARTRLQSIWIQARSGES